MAHIIAKPCIGVKDAACVTACPLDCIHPAPAENGFAATKMLFIDPAQCIDCMMCVDECPVQAIFRDDDLPAEWNEFIERNAAYYRLESKT